MLDARFAPIDKWPGKATASYSRKSSPFKAGYANTLDLLECELHHLNARDVTIQAYFTRAEIRNDGWPKSSARPSQPGVIVGFDVRKSKYIGQVWTIITEEFSFPCDRFNGWEDNLRAIALALEALRKIDRYGVTQTGEQYKGWARLPEPTPTDQMSSAEAAEFIATYSGVARDHVLGGNLQQAYLRAAQFLHPDKPTGNHELFVRLQRAKEILETKR